MATLSREQEKEFLQKLLSLRLAQDPSASAYWKCPFCKSTRNAYQTRLVYALQSYEYDAEKKTLVGVEGPVLPVVPLICQTCGYIHFFSAVASGTLDESLGFAPR